MNKDVVKGKWNQFKGQVKQKWGKLTDDDMRVIEGNLDEGAGRLQERYGYERDRAEKEWREFWDTKTSGSHGAGGV